MRRSDVGKKKGNKIIVKIKKDDINASESLPIDASTECGDGSSLLACPIKGYSEETEQLLTDDLEQQSQKLQRDKEEKKRRDKQLASDAEKLKIAKANDRLRKLAGLGQ